MDDGAGAVLYGFTCQHSAAPASRAATLSGSCGSDCGESVHMAAATRPGTRRATPDRNPPCSRSAVAVVMAVRTNQDARIIINILAKRTLERQRVHIQHYLNV